ncbi:hypothetical protein GCM10009785_30290 [Brooklawnia cerclae]
MLGNALIGTGATVALMFGSATAAHAYGEKVWNEPRACGASYVATMLGSSGDQLHVIYSGSSSQRNSQRWVSYVRTTTFRSTYLNSTAATVSTSDSVEFAQYGCGF